MKAQPEYILQTEVCAYLNYAFPRVLYLSDTIASVRLTGPQQARNKKIQKEGFHCPDVLILYPRKGFAGLFIELKASTIYKKDGTLLKNDHVENQKRTIDQLNKLGYLSMFCVGFDEAKFAIDQYMTDN